MEDKRPCRKRKVLDFSERVKVVQRHNKGETAIAIAKSLDVGKTQIQNIIQNKEDILQRWENCVAGDRKQKQTESSEVQEKDEEAKEGESGDDEKGESGVRGCESGDEGDDELVIDFKTACQYSYALTKFALNNNMTALCDIFNNAKQDIEKAHLRKQANKKQIKMDRFLGL